MNFKKYFFLLLVGCLVSGALSGCSLNYMQAGKVEDEADKKLNVIVSILPQADLVEMIGGEKLDITVIIPPGASPDSFEPSTGNLKNVSKADLYIKVGHLPFEEAWIDRIISVNRNMPIADISSGIDIIDHDPHIWLSPRLAKKQVETICQALIEVDTNNQEFYLANLEKTLIKLDEMDKEIGELLAKHQDKHFLVYHPAWGYFANDYNLHEIAIEDHGKEPSPAEMVKIISLAQEKNITTIFTSPQHSTRSAKAIAEELGAQVVTIDPLPSSYEDIINSAKLISKALSD